MLAGFASAIVLGLVAMHMAYESVVRVLNPVPIRYGDGRTPAPGVRDPAVCGSDFGLHRPAIARACV